MTSTKKPYVPAKIPSKGKRAGTEKFSELCRRRSTWGFTNLGTWVVRDIRNKPGVMSQHAAGLALDLQYSDRAMCLKALDWLIANSDELGIALVNDYMGGASTDARGFVIVQHGKCTPRTPSVSEAIGYILNCTNCLQIIQRWLKKTGEEYPSHDFCISGRS